MGSSVHGGINRSGDGSAGNPYVYSIRIADTGFNNGRSMGNMPVNFVSFWNAARFANWMTSGTTEDGMYTLTPTSIANNTVSRNASAWANGGVAIANSDEWFKAAYYDGNGGYWQFPTQSNFSPTATTPNNTVANSANGRNLSGGGVDTVSEGGSYTLALSHYGTFDQAGNVWEWTEESRFDGNRDIRGGSYVTLPFQLNSNLTAFATAESGDVGFRVTSLAPIPEPSSFLMTLGGIVMFLSLSRRRFQRAEP